MNYDQFNQSFSNPPPNPVFPMRRVNVFDLFSVFLLFFIMFLMLNLYYLTKTVPLFAIHRIIGRPWEIPFFYPGVVGLLVLIIPLAVLTAFSF